MTTEEPICYKYHFEFESGKKLDFEINLDPDTLNVMRKDVENLPAWTERRYHQCPNCTLEGSKHTYCPIAVQVMDLVTAFKDHVSHETVNVCVETEQRNYSHRGPLQHAVSSLLGIYMTTSGCPVMEKLKPMVRYHLPFASLEETAYRHISMYLTAQFLRAQKGLSADWKLDQLISTYAEIHTLNTHFCKRITSEAAKDTNLNAVVILSNFTDFIPFNVSDGEIGNLATIFRSYLSSNGATEK
ncbi:MAG: hypothetical protein WCJ02_07230 [bacterium]